MKIRKAKKDDLKEYLKIKRESLKEYSKITWCKITLTNNQIKKELVDSISSPKRFLLFIEDDKIIGYMICSIILSEHQNYGYIDDIFVYKKFRGNGLGKMLINEFIKILRKKNIKKLRLGVNIRNKKAIKMYKELGFEVKHYEMDKEF
ncbi:GNAT family N-acetyltransferase [Candidatus Pacearchaeota archaeon]|nr:GNAT family N-acetyltransferase [Candidatus Pacearchaeota archaeon]